MLLTNNFKIPYLPHIFDISSIIFQANIVITDAASYPTFLIINYDYEIFYKGLIRAFYFLYSPFIWDIKTLYHLVGLFDASLYFVLTYLIIKNFPNVWANSITRIFFWIFIGYILIHGLGVGNFGTGIRHRSKFVIILIILAAPKIKKLVLNSSKNYKKSIYFK